MGEDLPVLDPALGKELPESVLEIILSKVPFPNLVSFRTVSHRWRSHIIPAATLPGQASKSVLLCTSSRPQLGDIEFHPLQTPPACTRRFAFDVRCNCWKDLKGSHGGLLLFALQSSEKIQKFVVWNPLTGKKRFIRPPSELFDFQFTDWRGILSGLVVDEETRSYKILAWGFNSVACVTVLYNSIDCSWKNTASMRQVMPKRRPFRYYCSRSINCSGGSIYFDMIYYKSLDDVSKETIKFDVGKEMWTRVQEQRAPFLGYCRVVADNGEVLFIEDLKQYRNHTVKKFHRRIRRIQRRSKHIVQLEMLLKDYIHEQRPEVYFHGYLGLRHKTMFYHMISVSADLDEDAMHHGMAKSENYDYLYSRTIIYKTSENSGSHFLRERLPDYEIGLALKRIVPFSPSLTALV